jgi:hypothetical protein
MLRYHLPSPYNRRYKKPRPLSGDAAFSFLLEAEHDLAHQSAAMLEYAAIF